MSLGPKALDTVYAAQRARMEAKHVGEFAKPPAGVPQKVLSERQDAEHAALEARYNRAAVAGEKTLPPAEKANPPRLERPAPPPVVIKPDSPPRAEPGKPKGPPARDSSARGRPAKGPPPKKPPVA